MKAICKRVSAEAAYFLEAGGDRTMVFVVNMEKTNMTSIAKPLFKMGAKVEFNPVMRLEDLKRAAERWVDAAISPVHLC